MVVILACEPRAARRARRRHRDGRLGRARRERPGGERARRSSEAGAPATIPQGGTLSIGWNGEIQWLRPGLGYDVTSWPAERLMFEPLLGYDEGTKLVPLLADGMPTVSADGKAYTFKLHTASTS